jgi:hypothetical protein
LIEQLIRKLFDRSTEVHSFLGERYGRRRKMLPISAVLFPFLFYLMKIFSSFPPLFSMKQNFSMREGTILQQKMARKALD